MREETGRPIDQSSGIKVKGLTSWERQELQRSGKKSPIGKKE